MSGQFLGRHMCCVKCEDPILSEKDGFTSPKGPTCQLCGLENNLTKKQLLAILCIQRGDNVVDVRKRCFELRTFPPTDKDEESLVEFSSPDGTQYCIIHTGQ